MLLCLVSRFIDCYVVCHYAKYWNAECHYAQCRHVSLNVIFVFLIFVIWTIGILTFSFMVSILTFGILLLAF